MNDLPDFETMTDEEIDAWTPEAEDATDPSGEAEDTAPATEQSESDAAPPAPTPEPETPARDPSQDDPAPKPDRTVPLGELLAERQKRQEAQQEAARLKAEQEKSQLQAHYDRLFDEEGPEAAEQFRLGVVQRQEEARRQGAATQAALDRIQMSREVLLSLPEYKDYEAQEAKVIAKYGLEEAQRLAAKQANPAKWAYEEGKSIQTPEERDTAFKEAVAKEVALQVKAQVDAALSKNQPPAPRAGKPGIEHAGSDLPASLEDMDPDLMSDAQLAAFDRESRRRLHKR